MSNPFTVIIQIDGKPEHVEAVVAGLEALIVPSRAEPGCLRYESFVDLSDPNHFTIIEQWEREEQWHAHLEAPHTKQSLAALAEALAKPFTAQRLSALPQERP